MLSRCVFRPQHFRFRQTNVGDFVGDIKDNWEKFVGNAENWHHKNAEVWVVLER